MRVTENFVIHVDRPEISAIHIDWAARPTCMTEFYLAHMLCSCHAWFFFNSDSAVYGLSLDLLRHKKFTIINSRIAN
jgi:hypothetical protein